MNVLCTLLGLFCIAVGLSICFLVGHFILFRSHLGEEDNLCAEAIGCKIFSGFASLMVVAFLLFVVYQTGCAIAHALHLVR
jgi:hypothetical protein